MHAVILRRSNVTHYLYKEILTNNQHNCHIIYV